MTKNEKMLLIPLVVLACVCSLLIGLLIGGRNKTSIPEAVEPEIIEPTVKPSEPVEPSNPVEPETVPPVNPTEPVQPVQPSEPTEGNHHVVIPDDATGGDLITDPNYKPDDISVKEYRYVTASVLNVRSAPGTEYDIIACITRGTEVGVITDRGDWMFIQYSDGERGYVSSQYLSDSKTNVPTGPDNKDSVLAEMKERGNIGRLSIPEFGLSVAVFDNYSQGTVDNHDSAAILYSNEGPYGMDIVADHVNQGFYKIKSSVAGKTTLKFDFGTYVKNYKCVDNFVGFNTGPDLVDAHGKTIRGRNDGGLCLYTCNSNGSITITFWQPM